MESIYDQTLARVRAMFEASAGGIDSRPHVKLEELSRHAMEWCPDAFRTAQRVSMPCISLFCGQAWMKIRTPGSPPCNHTDVWISSGGQCLYSEGCGPRASRIGGPGFVSRTRMKPFCWIVPETELGSSGCYGKLYAYVAYYFMTLGQTPTLTFATKDAFLVSFQEACEAINSAQTQRAWNVEHAAHPSLSFRLIQLIFTEKDR